MKYVYRYKKKEKALFDMSNLHDILNLVRMGSVLEYLKAMLSHMTWKHFTMDCKLNFVFSLNQNIFWM